MKSNTSRAFALLITLFVFLCPTVAEASIVGLYYPRTGEKLSVHLKDGKPFLRIEVESYQDLPECTGYRVYRETPFERTPLELMEGDKGRGTGFGLWEPRACLEAYWKVTGANGKMPLKRLIQEIDIYNDFFGYFTNKEDLVKGFEAGEFFLALLYQSNYDGHESKRREVFYTYQDVVAGKVLLNH